MRKIYIKRAPTHQFDVGLGILEESRGAEAVLVALGGLLLLRGLGQAGLQVLHQLGVILFQGDLLQFVRFCQCFPPKLRHRCIQTKNIGLKLHTKKSNIKVYLLDQLISLALESGQLLVKVLEHGLCRLGDGLLMVTQNRHHAVCCVVLDDLILHRQALQ